MVAKSRTVNGTSCCIFHFACVTMAQIDTDLRSATVKNDFDEYTKFIFYKMAHNYRAHYWNNVSYWQS